MVRLALVLTSPLLLAFAPVPVVKPMTDPDKAIQQFDQEVQSKAEDAVLRLRSRLKLRLGDLRDALEKRGRADEAASVADRLALIDSIDTNKSLGDDRAPADILKRASGEGRYRNLLHVLYVPNDRTTYSAYNEFGPWPGTSYLGYSELQRGHWVYSHPRWFIWRDAPK